METYERSNNDRVRSEVANAAAAFETKVQDTILTAMDNSVLPRVELAMKSVKTWIPEVLHLTLTKELSGEL